MQPLIRFQRNPTVLWEAFHSHGDAQTHRGEGVLRWGPCALGARMLALCLASHELSRAAKAIHAVAVLSFGRSRWHGTSEIIPPADPLMHAATANERTFLHWMNMSVTIGSISAALLGKPGLAPCRTP